MKNFYLITIFIFTFRIFINAQETTQNLESLRQEAKDFSLKIVKSYFTENCDYIYRSMSDSLLIMDGDGILSKISKKEKLCNSTKAAIRDKQKTFKDYLNSYKIEILTQKALEKKFNKKLPEYYKTINSDFFFLGYKLKKEKNHINDFIWDDMFIFMVRKKGDVWFIKGLSG